MTLQEALFFSSLKTAIYERGLSSYGTAHRCYRVQVTIKQEASQVNPERLEDIYEISIARREGEQTYPPHTTLKARSLTECLNHLNFWTVGDEFEAPWQPVETWEHLQ